jgi:hypothetical protein
VVPVTNLQAMPTSILEKENFGECEKKKKGLQRNRRAPTSDPGIFRNTLSIICKMSCGEKQNSLNKLMSQRNDGDTAVLGRRRTSRQQALPPQPSHLAAPNETLVGNAK